MLTRLARWQLSIFAAVTVFAIGTLALYYLRVPEALGIGRYTVTANFAASGGLYPPNGNVTYRGSTVGRITAVTLTDNLSVDVHMRLYSDTAIPADVTAAAKSVSAIGEQYVDLIPPTADSHSAADLRNGSVIDRSHTTLSGDIAGLLREAQGLVSSLDQSKLKDVLRETATAFDGSGPELARLINSTKALLDELHAGSEDTTTLIDQLGPFLDARSAAATTSPRWPTDWPDSPPNYAKPIRSCARCSKPRPQQRSRRPIPSVASGRRSRCSPPTSPTSAASVSSTTSPSNRLSSFFPP